MVAARAPGPSPHPGPGRPRGPGDRGAVTIEAAIALGSLALVTAAAVAAIAVAGASIRCADAAHELVRLAARGEPDRGRAIAARLAPPGAQITLSTNGDEATAEVTVTPVRLLPVPVSGRAVAVLEPDGAALPTVADRGGRPVRTLDDPPVLTRAGPDDPGRGGRP